MYNCKRKLLKCIENTIDSLLIYIHFSPLKIMLNSADTNRHDNGWVSKCPRFMVMLYLFALRPHKIDDK